MDTMVHDILQKMGFEPEIRAVVPFLREEDGSPYQVWKIETAQGSYVLKKTSRTEKEVYEVFLPGCDYAPKLYGAWQDQGETWLLMEYIQGERMSHCTREKLKRTLDALISGQKQYWQDTTLAEVGYRYGEVFQSRCRRLAYLGELSECYSAYLDEFAAVPRTLCSDDLLPFNVLVNGDRAVILDWADAGILPYPCGLARLLAFGMEEPDWIFQMTQADREFALDYYYENLIREKGISRNAYDRTMKLFFFKEYSEWICCAARSGDYGSLNYKKYAPMAEKLARELMNSGT